MKFGFFKKLFKVSEDYLSDFEMDDDEEDEFEWDWDHITEERQLFRMSDEVQREKYIRSLVEQVKDASTEMDKLSNEYNFVTATLKDMVRMRFVLGCLIIMHLPKTVIKVSGLKKME